jgi:plasmid stabilization system protein ParE
MVHKQVRMALVRRFPYLVFYTPEANQITVFFVFHAARDPRMWKRRV